MKEVSDGSVPWSACLEGLQDEILGLWDERFALMWNSTNWYNTPRGALVLLSHYVRSIDAKWTGTSHAMEPDLWEYFERMDMTSDALKALEQMRYKYGMNIEGTGNGDRVYWQLQMGQVGCRDMVRKVEEARCCLKTSPTAWCLGLGEVTGTC